MDPISAGLGIVGLGMQLFGGLGAASVAKQQAAVSSDIATQEQGINAQKQQQMQLEARRQQMQNFRNAQRARAQAVNASVQGGSQLGSGLGGGLAGIFNTSTENALGVNQAVQTSQNIFTLNNKISQDKVQLAQLGGQAATDQMWSSLGGGLVKNSGMIGKDATDAASWAGGQFSNVFGWQGTPTSP